MSAITQADLDALRQLLAEDPTIGKDRIARALGIPPGRAQRLKKKLESAGELPPIKPMQQRVTESRTMKGDELSLELQTPVRVMTLEQLCKVCELDQSEWDVKDWKCTKSEVGMKVPTVSNVVDGKMTWTRDSAKPVIVDLWHVSARFVRKTRLIEIRKEIDELIAKAKKHSPKYAPYVMRRPPSGNMLELHIPDLHLGKLAWGPETGYQDYDAKLAEDIYHEAVRVMVERSRLYEYEKVVMTWGNDFQQADNKRDTTTSGTVVDTDSRYKKLAYRAIDIAVATTDRLATVARDRHLVIVPGNHDEESSFHLGHKLEIWYRHDKNVTVDNGPMMRKYLRFGRVGLMWLHSHKGKKLDYGLLFATERPDIFGPKGSIREIHGGHLHQEMVSERFGVKFRQVDALCPADVWHSDSHFVGMLRGAQGYMWSKEQGLLGTIDYTLPE